MTTTIRSLTATAGLSREVGLYFAGMEEVRQQLHEALADLSVEENGRIAMSGAHSIGALMLHIGEAEWWWTRCVIGGHKLTEEDRKAPFWDVLKYPESFAAKGHTAEFCLSEAGNIRAQTRELLASFEDKDLDQVFSFERRGNVYEHTLRWILHHLIDHEAQHKGQILMLKRLLGKKGDDLFN